MTVFKIEIQKFLLHLMSVEKEKKWIRKLLVLLRTLQ